MRGHGGNGQLHIECQKRGCPEKRMFQFQRDLLKEQDVTRVPDELNLPKPTQRNVIPVPDAATPGGVTRDEARFVATENTAFTARLTAACSMEGVSISIHALRIHIVSADILADMPGDFYNTFYTPIRGLQIIPFKPFNMQLTVQVSVRRMSRAMEVAGVSMPESNYKQGKFKKVMFKSAAEASQEVDRLVRAALKRRTTAARGGRRTKITELIVAGDAGWQARRLSQHGCYVLVECHPKSTGGAILCVVTMSRNANQHDIREGIARYTRAAENMEADGMEDALLWLTSQDGCSVNTIITDGDVSASGTIHRVFTREGTSQGEWVHVYCVNHYFVRPLSLSLR